MTTTNLLFFLAFFMAPTIYQRTNYRLRPRSFDNTNYLRRKTGFNIHHAHYGLVYMILSGLWMSFLGTNPINSCLFALGLGLLLDEFIPSLRSPSNGRDKELILYHDCLRPTLILIAMTALAICALFFLTR